MPRLSNQSAARPAPPPIRGGCGFLRIPGLIRETQALGPWVYQGRDFVALQVRLRLVWTVVFLAQGR
jgi:hypothetical protein